MAEFNFDFCPNSRVAETIAPEEPSVKDFNGWDYTPKPVLPYRRRFRIYLEGIRWYFDSNGNLDLVTDPEHNAGRLESFYTTHRLFKEWNFNHEWLGTMELRFESPLSVPMAVTNSNGLCERIEINAIHHNPSY